MAVNEVLTTIKKRRSVRSFKPDQITEAELQTVLEAGIYAPSAGNQQLWHFTVIQDKQVLDQLNTDAKQAQPKLITSIFSKWLKMKSLISFTVRQQS
jgi:nitroreductase